MDKNTTRKLFEYGRQDLRGGFVARGDINDQEGTENRSSSEGRGDVMETWTNSDISISFPHFKD